MTTLIEINLDLIGQSINQHWHENYFKWIERKKTFQRSRSLNLFFFANNFIGIFHHDGDNDDDDDDE